MLLLRSTPLLYSAFCSILTYFGIRSRAIQNEGEKELVNQTISDYRSLVLRSLLGWTTVASFQFVEGPAEKSRFGYRHAAA